MGKNIILIGMPGCGKTTIGEILAKEMSYQFCDLDKYIVDMEKMTIDEMFENGEDYFRDIESKAVKEVYDMKSTVIATGGGIINRQENIDYLKKNGFVVFIDRPIEDIVSDVDTESRPLLKDGKDKLYELLEERYPLYQKNCNIELINDSGIDLLIERILGILK